jgi:hypothetical protein
MTRVRVLAVQSVTDIVTGETAVQVLFGDLVPSNQGIRERFAAAEQQPPVGDQALHQILTLLLPSSGIEPYQVGSQWDLARNSSGEITLRKAK